MSEGKSGLYRDLVVLNSEVHRELKISSVKNYRFAAEIDSCVLLIDEFFEAARCYPIVFSRTGREGVMPMVILGFNGNAFVDSDGNWREGYYIPAYIRRYPYILAETDSSEDKRLFVAVDRSYEGYGTEDGDRLFGDDGSATEVLGSMIEFLKLYNAGFEATRRFVERIEELDLLTGIDANIKLPDGKTYIIKNLMAVDEEKMLGLDDESLFSLTKSKSGGRGYIAWIYAHIISLNNFVRVTTKD